MKRLLSGLLFVLVSAISLWADDALVVQTCGTLRQQYAPGATRQQTVDINGNTCTDTGGSGTQQDVNLKQVGGATTQTGHGTAAGVLRVELPSDGTGLVGLNAGINIVGSVRIDQTTPGTTNGVQVNVALPAGSNIIGNVRIDQTTPGTTNGVAAQATENHVGEVGGNLLPITSAMTTSNNTVTTGKSVGGLQTLANAVRVSGALGASGTSGIIQSAMLTFKDAIGSIPFDVYYFNANPTGSTCTDNTTFALVDADRDKVVGIAHITDLTASNTAAIGQAQNQAIPFGVASATSIYACVVTRGSAVITGTANASLITRVLRN